MSRPVGVTASAIVAILGSIFALLLAVLSVASLLIETARPQPPNSAQLAIAGVAMFAALAGIGIWTSVTRWGLLEHDRGIARGMRAIAAVVCVVSIAVAFWTELQSPRDQSVEATES